MADAGTTMSSAFSAVENGDIRKLQSLLKGKKKILQETNKHGQTLLMVAAIKGHLEVVELLLKHRDAENTINQVDKDGRSASFLAAKNGNYEILKLLTAPKYAAKIEGEDRHGDSILMGPARSGFSIIVQHLLELHRGADPNIQDTDGWTPLMLAASKGQKDVVQCLLENNASVALKGYRDCTTAMREAVKGGHVEVIQMLAEAETKLDKKNGELYLCKTPEEARELIKANASVNQEKGDGTTPLMFHAKKGNTDICHILLENGAHMNKQDLNGYTALMKACCHGHQAIIDLFIKKNPFLNLKTCNNWTALMFAVELGHSDIVRALTLAGADMAIRNKEANMTALDIAKDKGNKEIVAILERQSKLDYQHKAAKPFIDKLGEVTRQPVPETGSPQNFEAQVTRSVSSLPEGILSMIPSISTTPADGDHHGSEVEARLREDLYKAQEKVVNLETRVQELTLRTTLDLPDDKLDHLPLDRVKEELLKARELKKKMEKYATDAKQAAQRLSAENHKLKEQVAKEKHAHELHWKNLLREVEQKLSKKSADEDLKNASLDSGRQVAYAVARRDLTEFPTSTITPGDVKKFLFEQDRLTSLKMDMFLLVFSGLPNSGKSTLLRNFKMDQDLLEVPRNSPHPSARERTGLVIYELGYLKNPLDPVPLWMISTGKELVILMMVLAIIKKCSHKLKTPSFSLDIVTSDLSHEIPSAFQSPLLQDNFRFILERIKILVPDMIKKTNPHLNATLTSSRLTIFNCWDVGVCRAMYTILPLLANASKRLFMINLLDLSRDGSDLCKSPVLEDYDDNNFLMQQRSKLHYLLRIPGLTRETAMSVVQTLCTTIVVANIKKDPKVDREKLKELLQDASTAIFQKADDVGIGPLLHPDVLALDVSSNSGAEHVQRIIEEIIELANCLEVDMPLNWMFFRTALYNYPAFYITKMELCDMATECNIYKEEELLRFLSLFTHIGSLLYFPAVLGEYIVLRPQGFFDAINKLFYPKGLIEEGHKRVLSNGFLCNVVAEKLWKKEAPLFMTLLCESSLACDLSKLPTNQSQYCDVCPANNVTQCLYIPALRVDDVATPSEDSSTTPNVTVGGSGRTAADRRSLFVTFNTEHIPTSLETVIIKYLGLALLSKSPEMSDLEADLQSQQKASELFYRQDGNQQRTKETTKQPQSQFTIDFDFKQSTHSNTVLRLTPVEGSEFYPLGQQVIISIISHGDVLEIKFHLEPLPSAGQTRSKSDMAAAMAAAMGKESLESFFCTLLKNLVVGCLSKVLVYFKDVRYQLAFPCPSVTEDDQVRRLGHFLYFHPHDEKREHLFCYYQRETDLDPRTDRPPSPDQHHMHKCMKHQPLSPWQQKWMEAHCTFSDESNLFGLDENDKLQPTELRELAERITNSSFTTFSYNHMGSSSFCLDPEKHIKLCEALLTPHIPSLTYLLDKIKVLHQSKTPADLVAAALKEWQGISPANTKYKLAELLYQSGYYLESLHLDARLVKREPSMLPLTTKELTLISLQVATNWKDLAKLLHLTTGEVKTIKQSIPKTPRRKIERCLQMLELWRQKPLVAVDDKIARPSISKVMTGAKGDGGERDVLRWCLEDIGYHQLADMLVTMEM